MRIIKNILLESFSLYILTLIFPNFLIIGGIQTYLMGGLILWLLSLMLKPIFKFIAAPFYILTFGLLSIVINAFIFFILTKIINNINVTTFKFNGLNLLGIIIPRINLNLLESFIIVSISEIMIKYFILWIARE